MKILHTADLHLGQLIYQNYDRTDEHKAFFEQLTRWCVSEQPDALVVSGDVFDIQQPSAAVWKFFTDNFVALHIAVPKMAMVIVAGNHDSPSRIHSQEKIWGVAGVKLVGLSPSTVRAQGWESDYVVELPTGFIVALPYMTSERTDMVQELLDYVANKNPNGLPVVMTGHLAVTASDAQGHDWDIGKVRCQDISSLGSGYDYLALGHIHKPQTLGHSDGWVHDKEMVYEAPVARYAGSALHVSCDEAYPHSVSLVEIDRHCGTVKLRVLRINELRHFYILPSEDAYDSEEAALRGIKEFVDSGHEGYIRLRISYNAKLQPDFNQQIFRILEPKINAVRYNPQIIFTRLPDEDVEEREEKLQFEIAQLQAMTDPMDFIEQTIDNYPHLEIDFLRQAFEEVKNYLNATNS